MSDGDSLSHIMQRLDEFVAERDWNQFHSIKNLVAAVCVEAAELSETVQWTNPSISDAQNDVLTTVLNLTRDDLLTWQPDLIS